MKLRILPALTLGIVAVSAMPARAQSNLDQLANSTLEEIANAKIQVSSVSRKEEDIDKAPAAVYVVTRDDIARSSASSIPDLLRTVPGLQVAEITASTWAISARGFNSAYADKTLVLIDGRTVYSEIYSGVHWDEIDLPLNLIERIEIIRGPGAAVWGANAVNGVINIITRPAREVEGTTSSGEISNTASKLLLQKGGPIGDRVQYSSFVSFIDRRPLVDALGHAAFDGNATVRAGGRLDYQRDMSHSFNLFGDIYRGKLRQQVGPFLELSLQNGGLEHDSIAGGFLQGAYRVAHGGATTDVQAYYVDSTRNELASHANTQMLNFELVHHQRANSRVDLVWGAEARYTHDHTSGEGGTVRPSYNNYMASGFIQADFTLKPGSLTATLGTKLQNGTLTGSQLQPSARLMWTVDSKQSVWGAVSRAIVAPSLQDKAISVPLNLGTQEGLPVIGTLLGQWSFRPEEVVAYEVGYRNHLSRSVAVDLAGFANQNHRLQSLATSNPAFVFAPEPHITVNELYTNGFSGISEGLEAAVTWRPSATLDLRGSYSWEEAQVQQTLPGMVFLVDAFATPKNTVAGNVLWSVSRDWTLQAQAAYAGNVPLRGALLQPTVGVLDHVPEFTRVDVSVQRKVRFNTMLQAGATNLLQPRHPEFGSQTTFLVPHYVPRAAFARATWTF